MNDPKALFYLIPYTAEAKTVAQFPENAHYLADTEKINYRREVQALLPTVDCRDPDSDGDSELEADSEATTREGTPNATETRIRDTVLRFGFDGMREAAGFVFGRDLHSHVLLAQPDTRDISRTQFRIHFNLDNRMLMLTDNSRFGTFVQGVRVKRESVSLTSDTPIFCGEKWRLGFLLQLQDYTGYEEAYIENFRAYVAGMGCNHSSYLPTPAGTPGRKSIGKGYDILETVAEGVFGSVYTVMHRKTGRLYAAKDIVCEKNNHRPVVPMEVAIFSKVSHVSVRSHGRVNVIELTCLQSPILFSMRIPSSAPAKSL